MKQIGAKHLAFLGIGLFTVFFGYVYAADTTSDTFISQSSTGLGSSSSVISTELYPRPSGSGAYYINSGNNSSIVGNYFEGYYYDSVLGYFEFDWSSNKNENVRVIGSTDICPDSYGYKLGGYSYSPAFGFMDFDFNSDTYVYYCEEDEFLRGYAYNDFLGFQNFEGIAFDIGSQSDIPVDPPDEDDDRFINPGTDIDEPVSPGETGEADSSTQTNSNFTKNTIQNDRFEFDVKLESLFYIIK